MIIAFAFRGFLLCSRNSRRHVIFNTSYISTRRNLLKTWVHKRASLVTEKILKKGGKRNTIVKELYDQWNLTSPNSVFDFARLGYFQVFVLTKQAVKLHK